MSQRTSPTEAGEINRQVSEERGRELNSGTSAEFGQSIGRAENLSEGGEMRNDKDKDTSMNRNVGMGNESSRHEGSGDWGSSPESTGNQGSSISRDDKSPGRGGSGTLGSTGTSEGRH